MVILTPKDGDRKRLAAELLAAAGDQPERVQVVTDPVFGFVVDDDLAAKVEKPAPKKAPRKATAKSETLTVVDGLDD